MTESRDEDYDAARYQGKPLLALQDYYVLSCITELDEEQEQALAMMTNTIWEGSGTWKEKVILNLGLNAAMEEEIHELWEGSRTTAEELGVDLKPWEFAKQVCDKNFANHL